MMETERRESSSFGFKNIQPKTRQERAYSKDVVALEKHRINQRVGFSARMHQENAFDDSSGLTTCVEKGAGYLSNADRFHTDTSGEEYAQRQDLYARKQKATEFRKQQSVSREDERWKKIEELKKADDERMVALREAGMKAKKNQSGAAYDVTNLEYSNTPQGEAQRYNDDLIRFRAEVRAHNLVVKGDSRANYNILSGEDRNPPPVPDRVPVPETVRSFARGRR